MEPPPPLPSDDSIPSKSISALKNKKTKKKRKLLSGYTSDTASSSTLSFPRRVRVGAKVKKVVIGSARHKEGDVAALALPLGMSIAAVVAQVLERKESMGEGMAVDHLSKICTLAVRESLANVFGEKFDTFVNNFEKSFRSTLMTLRLINETSQCSGEQDTHSNDENSHENTIPRISLYTDRGNIEERFSDQNAQSDVLSGQMDLQDFNSNFQLACVSRCTSLSRDNTSSLSTYEKSVMEQTRANDLKTFEIGLSMKKLHLKEKQIALSSDSNFLERWKLSMGISKASFKADKFKYEVEETRRAELLRKCIDYLVASLFIMLASIAYGTYVFSHNRIIEATASCMPAEGSKSWWMPKTVTTLSSGMQIIWCQVQVLSRMLFGALMILVIAYLLLQRSSLATQTMPITFILLLGFACGFAGKLCIDTLGGSGYIWLLYWETQCILHFLSHIFTSSLFLILYGPVRVSRVVNERTRFPFWLRRVMFHAIVLVVLPLLCGLMPFASPSDWKDHFKSQVIDFLPVPEIEVRASDEL